MPDRPDQGPPSPGDIAPGAMTEYLADDWGYFIRSARQFEKFKSPFQAIEVHESVRFGKLFRLDGHFMTSEKDEFFYHENLVQTAAITHPQPTSALVIGGGDGGSVEELLKHASIRSVTLCEIDLAVIDVARKYLQSVHRGALDDPRLTLKIGDGFEHVRSATAQYDLIVLDLTDAGGPSSALYTPDFYRACAARLAPTGLMSLHVASPVAHPERIRETLGNLRSAFTVVTPFLTSVPLYGGLWMMACCSSSPDPKGMSILDVDRRIAQRGIRDLQFYNGDTHRASMALPNFVRALVA
jgi:spermidine synthase